MNNREQLIFFPLMLIDIILRRTYFFFSLMLTQLILFSNLLLFKHKNAEKNIALTL